MMKTEGNMDGEEERDNKGGIKDIFQTERARVERLRYKVTSY
jgi:hypothetical protein